MISLKGCPYGWKWKTLASNRMAVKKHCQKGYTFYLFDHLKTLIQILISLEFVGCKKSNSLNFFFQKNLVLIKSSLKDHSTHHTVIPPWIYRIPSELRSQAGLGLPSTVVGDHTGIVSAVCYIFL